MDTLLLNADASPVTMLPLSVISWQDSIRYLVLDKVSVLEWHDDWIVRSATWETRVPAVIMLKEYYKKNNYIRYSKMNVFLRDLFECQYCGVEVNKRTATLDHVLPQSHGGRSTWENSTTACKPCNYRKAASTKMKPKKMPHKPHFWELVDRRRSRGFHIEHPSWADYLNL